MSVESDERRTPEFIVVRRNGDDEGDDHQSGVWKIAFADFMTAMMCFFLVMWLINAADEETRVALASYFNPVKLVDRSTSSKGLDDVSSDAQFTDLLGSVDANILAPSPQSETPIIVDVTELSEHSDANYFSNPYAVLAEIVAETGRDQNISSKGEGGEQNAGPSSGASAGEAYRDPFAPDFWSQQVEIPGIGVQGDPDQARDFPNGSQSRAQDSGEGSQTELQGPTAGNLVADANTQADETGDFSAGQPIAAEATVEQVEAADAHENIAADIRHALEEALQGEGLAASVSVSAGQDGVLISITDDLREGMFAVGSAVPERNLVLAMEKIAQTLNEHSGSIRIHGHTDARPFMSNNYDNWRLSTARAHSAQYMLVRGGLEEERIKEVAGFADRRLKLPEDPLADVNRRIEILLEVPE